jgi:hypothetical protein
MSLKAEDIICVPHPYTAFPRRGDAPSSHVLDLKVRDFACNKLTLAQALEVYPVTCGLVTCAYQREIIEEPVAASAAE